MANPCYAHNVWGGVHSPSPINNPPPNHCSEVDLQWLQSDPPWNHNLNLGCSEVDLHWMQFNFAVTAVQPPLLESELELGLQWSWSALNAVQLCSDCSPTPPPPGKTSRTHVVACHLLVKVLWVTSFTHFTSWSGKSHKAKYSSWDKSKHFYLDNSESG